MNSRKRSIFATRGGCSAAGRRRSSPLPARRTIRRTLSIIIKTRQTYVDLVRGPRRKPGTTALFNSPAVLTETGLSGCSGSLSIGTCAPHGPATPGAPWSRRDSSARNVQRPSPRLPPALVLLRTPGEESARPWMSTLPGEPGRMLVPARLAGFLYGSGTRTVNYRSAEQRPDSERSLIGTRSRGAGSAKQHGTRVPHPSCNPAGESSITSNEGESVLPGPPYRCYRQLI